MAGRQDRRIEPSFGEPARRRPAGELVLQEDDRILPSNRKPRRKPSSSRKKSSRRRRGSGTGFFGRLLYWGCVAAIWAGIGLAGLVAYYGAQLPAATSWAVPERPPNVKIVAVDGKLVANRGVTGGEALGLHEMSPYIPEAVIAVEDRRFYSHFGIDPLGLGRAMVGNLLERRVSQGGSTLTQQLAKNLFLTPERTLERKVQEVLLALWLEHSYSKDQILDMYLNRVYFGSGAYGVEAASRRYFNKSARNVTLSEAAVLAGLLKAPSRLSPARDPKAANERARLVLAAMRSEGMIGDKELAAASEAPTPRAPSYWTGSENYVADRVMEELPDLVGEVRTDLVVDTTVDMTLQKLAEKSLRKLIDENGKKLNVSQGALVSIDNSGAVRAMVGGYDYAGSQFDRASEARRQPGSAFKPFVYVAALEAGRTPDSVRNDAPIRIGKWEPANFGGKYYGQVSLTTALSRSLNSVAAQLAQEVGPKAVVEVAHRMGIGSSLQANVSLALGTSEVTPLELTAAYVPFANGGFRPRIHLIQRIATASGKVLYEAGATDAPRVLKPEIVGMMNAMMAQTISGGTARQAAFGWPAAGKTGTSQNSRDAWFVGYTSNLTTGVWFGNDNGSPTKNITGGGLPTIAWHDFMKAAHHGVPVVPLPGWTRPIPVPAAPTGPDDAVAAARDGAAPVPPLPVSAARGTPTSDLPTASIGRPVPPADVGTQGTRRQGGLFGAIFGDR